MSRKSGALMRKATAVFPLAILEEEGEKNWKSWPESVTFEHHQPAMTASLLQRFCRTFSTTKSKISHYSDRFLGDQT
jgi:hypothetical protein